MLKSTQDLLSTLVWIKNLLLVVKELSLHIARWVLQTLQHRKQKMSEKGVDDDKIHKI